MFLLCPNTIGSPHCSHINKEKLAQKVCRKSASVIRKNNFQFIPLQSQRERVVSLV